MLFKHNHNELGKTYADGEYIFRRGEPAESLFVILEGEVELVTAGTPPLLLDVLGKDELFGVISLFDGLPRPICARVRHGARVLTIDRKGFMQRLETDPGLALRILENMAKRSRLYLSQLVLLKEERGTVAAHPAVGRGDGQIP